MSEFLQFLIPDRDYGYLFPHSRSVAAFGVMNEYHITKHRAHLTEGVHYIKSASNGTDHVVRIFYTFNGLLLLADFVGTAPAVQLKQALLDHVQRQAQTPGALVPAQGGGMAYTQPQRQPQRQPQVATGGHDDSTPYGQPLPQQQWGQPALHSTGQMVPNAHGYVPVPQGTQPYGAPYGSSPDPAHQVAAALAPYVDRSVSRHLGTAQSQQEQSLQLVEAVTNTMLRAQEQSAAHIARAYEQASGNPHLQPPQPAVPPVLLLQQQQRSVTEWLKANDGWLPILLASGLICLVGVGTWIIASAVMSGMQSVHAQPTRLSPVYPSSATPFN